MRKLPSGGERMKFKDKISGKEFTFTPKPGFFMVKFKPDTDGLSAVRDLEDSQTLTPVFDSAMTRGFGCFQVISDKVDVSDFKQRPDIESVFPVVIDNEGNERYFLPGELTVQFKNDVKKNDQLSIISKHGCEVLREQATPGYYTLRLPTEKDMFEAIEEFNAEDGVLFAEPSNVGYHDALYIPNDPEFTKLWHLHNTGQTGGTADCDVDAPGAWDMEQGDSRIVIAVLDTGVDLDHEDLKDNILPRPQNEDWDFSDPDLIPEAGPEWWEDHGTHCAGIAAAVDNTDGIIGLAPKCSIMPIRIDLHTGIYANRADAINFITSINNRYERVIMSCSWKTNGSITAIANAITNANNNGILVIFAAGNDGVDTDVSPQYPGVMPEVLSVAATDHRDQKASFSNYGSSVDVSAPGVEIYSTIPDDKYMYKDGTSMACPLVAGLAGLIWSRNASLTHTEVRNIIEATCDNIDGVNPNHAGKLGSGRINAYRALKETPRLCKFKVQGRIKFPQKNAGSSSALAFYTQRRRWPWIPRRSRQKGYLLFLTQKPYSERIFYINPSTGTVVGSIDPKENDTIGSMTWDGTVIRVANVTTGAGFINSINPANGSLVGSIPAPTGRGEGMTYDGKYLYYSTVSAIHQIVPSNGHVVRSSPVPGGGHCHSLASNGGNIIFAGESGRNEVIAFERQSLNVVCRFSAPGKGNQRVEGLAFDPLNKLLFIANQSENIIYYGSLI
jgi:subtilisin family serine protease